MSQRIVLQPNGRFSIFDSEIDKFLFFNATVEELIEYRLNEERERIRKSVHKLAARLSKGEAVYGPFTTTWEQTIGLVETAHGYDAANLRWIRNREEL